MRLRAPARRRPGTRAASRARPAAGPPTSSGGAFAEPDDPPQHRPHPRDHLGAAERLDHVVVGAELQAHDPLELRPARGEDDDRHLGTATRAARARDRVRRRRAASGPAGRDRTSPPPRPTAPRRASRTPPDRSPRASARSRTARRSTPHPRRTALLASPSRWLGRSKAKKRLTTLAAGRHEPRVDREPDELEALAVRAPTPAG